MSEAPGASSTGETTTAIGAATGARPRAERPFWREARAPCARPRLGRSKTLLKLQLLPRWLTNADFRLAFTSGVSANSACFERELLDHHRLVFEKTDDQTGVTRRSYAVRRRRGHARPAANAP